MSYHYHKDDGFKTIREVLAPKHSFDAFIMQCCKASEKDLRKFLKKVLTRSGFTLFEDDYKSDRRDADGIHNLLAIRGNPKVCLVAHTDVCRDHERKNNRVATNNTTSSTNYSGSSVNPYSPTYNYSKENSSKPSNNPNAVAPTNTNAATTNSNNEEEEEKRYKQWWHDKEGDTHPRLPVAQPAKKETVEVKEEPRTKPDPVMYYQENDKKEYRHIITDRGNKIQIGGDDRLGVAINTYIALNTSHDMGLFYPTDEEIGLRSSDYYKEEQLNKFDLLVQTDRGNHSHQLVVKIGGTQLCNYLTACRLLSISHAMGIPRTPVTGMGTDVAVLKKNKKCKEACNMTVGYHKSYGAGADEYIWVEESLDTMRYVNEIIKSYQYEDLFELTGDIE